MTAADLYAKLDAGLSAAGDFAWGPPMLVLLFGTHLFLTLRLRFPQRYIGQAIRISLSGKKEGAGDISQFGALATALAATIGTGNIVGVATAVAAGGPGAVLWMWLTGVFGISTKYAEALLSVKYRTVNDRGEMAGGPMYVLERGLKSRWLGILFALFTAIAAFGIGNMVQANSIAQMIRETLAHYPATEGLAEGSVWVTGLLLSAFTALVILGGIRSIAAVCGRLVPFMAFFYFAGCVVMLAMHFDTVPASFLLIVKSAFSGHAAVGGFLGVGMREAVRYGIARGLFSNESGLGSAPIVAAAAQTKNPVRQALVSASGTFWDTVVVCAVTGLVIVNSGEWTRGLNGAALSKAAFGDFPLVGPAVLAVGLLTFVFSTILGWSYYGEKAAEYLFGPRVILPYRWLWVGGVMVGSVATLSAVWAFADVANGLMALPNLVSLLLLSGVAVDETQTYLWSGDLDREAPLP